LFPGLKPSRPMTNRRHGSNRCGRHSVYVCDRQGDRIQVSPERTFARVKNSICQVRWYFFSRKAKPTNKQPNKIAYQAIIHTTVKSCLET
jgi:hypothetical protein